MTQINWSALLLTIPVPAHPPIGVKAAVRVLIAGTPLFGALPIE